MSIEAMKQALEALENPWSAGPEGVADAITALRAAIKQAGKQEPVAYVTGYYGGRCVIEPLNKAMVMPSGMALYATQVAATTGKQTPVAYKWKGELFTPSEIEMLDVDDAVPLYQHPEPVECMCGICKLGKRQWVGLTDEEIAAVMHGSVEGERMLPYQFARAIEAELKAKNEAP